MFLVFTEIFGKDTSFILNRQTKSRKSDFFCDYFL